MAEPWLVLGKGSYIGRVVVRYARERGTPVLALGSSDCDLLDGESVLRLFRSLDDTPRRLLLLAAINKGTANSYDAYLQNVRLVKNVIDGVRRSAGIRSVVYLSSVDVYGNAPEVPLRENSPLAPDQWYALAKCTGEWMWKLSGEIDRPVAAIRIPGVYGPGRGDRSVVGRMVDGLRERGRLEVRGSGAIQRDFVYVHDLARLLYLLVPLGYDGALNVATGTSRSILDIARLVCRTMAASPDCIRSVPTDAARQFDLVFDTRRLRDLLPDFQFTPMEQALRSYVEGPLPPDL